MKTRKPYGLAVVLSGLEPVTSGQPIEVGTVVRVTLDKGYLGYTGRIAEIGTMSDGTQWAVVES